MIVLMISSPNFPILIEIACLLGVVPYIKYEIEPGCVIVIPWLTIVVTFSISCASSCSLEKICVVIAAIVLFDWV